MGKVAEGLQDDIISSFKDSIGTAWDKLSKEDMVLLRELAKDAADLHLQYITNPSECIDMEITIINASLMNLTVAKYFCVKKVFWASVKRAATLALSVLMRAALAAV